ncbi:conserved hypothetical protein [Gammaproteobacteria bacterium]
MNNTKLPTEYVPYDNVWVCNNIFKNGVVPIEVDGNAVFLIGKGSNHADSSVWLNLPKLSNGKRKWAEAIRNNSPIENGFAVHESSEGREVSLNDIPLIQYHIKDGTLFITLINLTSIGLNIFGGIKSLHLSGKSLENNTFEGVHTMIGVGCEMLPF